MRIVSIDERDDGRGNDMASPALPLPGKHESTNSFNTSEWISKPFERGIFSEQRDKFLYLVQVSQVARLDKKIATSNLIGNLIHEIFPSLQLT